MGKTPVATIDVEVVYALPHVQIVESLQVPAGTTLREALERSGIFLRYPEIIADSMPIGICGRRAETSAVLRAFDRIEIYRPLIADPKQARRTRARRAAKSKG